MKSGSSLGSPSLSSTSTVWYFCLCLEHSSALSLCVSVSQVGPPQPPTKLDTDLTREVSSSMHRDSHWSHIWRSLELELKTRGNSEDINDSGDKFLLSGSFKKVNTLSVYRNRLRAIVHIPSVASSGLWSRSVKKSLKFEVLLPGLKLTKFEWSRIKWRPPMSPSTPL